MPGGFGSLYRRHPVLFGGLLWGLSMVIVDAASDAVRGYSFRPGDLPASLVIALAVGWLMAWMINR
jgi:hypothetical protein